MVRWGGFNKWRSMARGGALTTARNFYASCFGRRWGFLAMHELARLLLTRPFFAGSSGVCCVAQAGVQSASESTDACGGGPADMGQAFLSGHGAERQVSCVILMPLCLRCLCTPSCLFVLPSFDRTPS